MLTYINFAQYLDTALNWNCAQMDKRIGFAIIGGIIVILILFVLFTNKNSPISVGFSTKSTSVNTTLSTVSTVITASTTSPTTTILTTSCLSQSSETFIHNGAFSTGTYEGWNATGLGFGSAPFNITKANDESNYYGYPWSNYSGSYVATTYQGGFVRQLGNLTSDPFEVVQPYLNFRIISPQNNGLYVQLLENGKPAMTAYFNTYSVPSVKNGNGTSQSTFVNASIPVSLLLCQNVSIRIVAQVVGTIATKNNYIAAGDFYMGRTEVEASGLASNITVTPIVQ